MKGIRWPEYRGRCCGQRLCYGADGVPELPPGQRGPARPGRFLRCVRDQDRRRPGYHAARHDHLGTLDTRISLRAERSGSGPGRTYTLTYRATDLAGNVATAIATVIVPHDGEPSGRRDIEQWLEKRL